ncbi:uncharacterized protein LOC124647719 [Lolium rigidum]|uniref:uncharacterized protein LOC124647719 n=1 Tax=Lolium rigidum TaxID=89674 RepID=UPI001F5C77AB|nr:uncharacterized protein LOC124647719 [Lolium rigidum]
MDGVKVYGNYFYAKVDAIGKVLQSSDRRRPAADAPPTPTPRRRTPRSRRRRPSPRRESPPRRPVAGTHGPDLSVAAATRRPSARLPSEGSLVPTSLFLAFLQWGGRTHFVLALLQQIPEAFDEAISELDSLGLTRLAASSTILLKLSGLVHVWLKYLFIVMVCFISSGSLKTAYLRFFGTLEPPNPIGSS